MMDHDELVEELANIDKLTTQERLRLAKKRRGQQLKRWAQREREYALKRKAAGLLGDQDIKTFKINFVASIMLMEAAARNDIEEVRRLLGLGVSPDSHNEDGLTALHQCCIDDSEEMMTVLVEHGANVNAADSEQWTPLHAAATCGHLHLVKFLIENGANLLAVNGDGNMPYDICEDDATLSFIENEMAKRGVTQELIDTTRARTENLMLDDLAKLAIQSADLEFRDVHGATPLHIAAANGYQSVLEFLLDHHCSTEVVDNDLWQPLHAAACWGHLEAVEILAQNGADISALTRAGETPFDITEDPDIKERLVELAEQRIQQAERRSKKGRSASTRTHSIRRTSLRDKMKTTKKDVTEEGLIYMKTVTTNSEGVMNGVDDYQPSEDIVDVGDVKLTLNNNGSPSNMSLQSSPSIGGGMMSSNRSNDFSSKPVAITKPIQMVSPFNKSHDISSIPPQPPSRSSREKKSSPMPGGGSLDDMSANMLNSSSQQQNINNNRNNWSSPPSAASKNEPINIHVSVTINPGPAVNQTGDLAPQHRSPQHVQYVNPISFPGNTGTLADLKRSRSQSRVSGSGSSNSSNASLAAADSVNMKPRPEYRGGSTSVAVENRDSGSETSPTTGRKKFAASSIEVVGPPTKSGCCIVL